jgi:hypothetical protein
LVIAANERHYARVTVGTLPDRRLVVRLWELNDPAEAPIFSNEKGLLVLLFSFEFLFNFLFSFTFPNRCKQGRLP